MAGTNNITIYGVNNTINGGSTQILDVNGSSAQCVINGQTEWLINKSYDSGGSNAASRVIAKLENINLKDELPNVLDWIGSNLASNTSATQVVVKPISGAYVPKVIPAVPATTTIVFDDTKFPSNLGLQYAIQIYVGQNEVFTGNVLTGFASNADYMDFVKTKYEDAGYGVVINGLNMALTGAAGLGAAINGAVNLVQSRDENAPDFTNSLSSSPPFSGGINTISTNIDFILNGGSILIGGSLIINLLPSLVVGANIIVGALSTAGVPELESTGNYALPVTFGTQDDFVISIFIYGDSI